MPTRQVAGVLLLWGLSLIAAEAATVTGAIEFGQCGPPSTGLCFSGSGNDTYQDERTRSVSNPPFNSSEQRAAVDIDFAAGTLKGRQSTLHFGSNISFPATTARAGLNTSLKIAAMPGSPTGSPVLLEFEISLHGEFLASDLVFPEALADNIFNARAELKNVFGNTFNQVSYQYRWIRSFTGDEVHHQKGLFPTCAGCANDIRVPDPAFLHEYRNGFSDVVMYLAILMLPGADFSLDFRIDSTSQVRDMSAVGEWDQTAQIGYRLPAGYILTDGAGVELSAWDLNATVVPLPAPLSLFAFGSLGMLWAARARRRT